MALGLAQQESTTTDADKVTLTISDSGNGVPENALTQRFAQGYGHFYFNKKALYFFSSRV
ncbi:MAG: hypothetical protein COB83_12530 [Gammaproteobacteria bacterium]|nr:MAG: hypothetical protein COB83_12530 [Gammaproteobacteria bacterium]